MKVSTIQAHINQYGMSPITRENEEAINEFNSNLSDYDKRVYKRLLLAFNNYYIEFDPPKREKKPRGTSWL